MSKKNKATKRVPCYVQELRKEGVVVLTGRTPEELADMVSAIPEDCPCYCGPVTKFYDTGMYRVQVNRK